MDKPTRICLNCRHFRNSPRYLESVYKGLTSLSSAYASVRKDDGICVERDLYLSASACCERYAAREPPQRTSAEPRGTRPVFPPSPTQV
jgi:hypothetical protein